MILYDSHSVRSFLQVRGSVFPRALRYAIPSAILGVVLRYLHNSGFIDLDAVDINPNGGIYQGFAYVISFLLVFRSSQSYSRYWASSRSAHAMGAEWFDAAGSLIAFAHSSDASAQDVLMFSHTAVRLFCILHAMALEEIADIASDEHFLLLDTDGLEKEDLRILTRPESQGRKVEIVNQWIKSLILSAMKNKVLSVPPPVLTRVFQQLGAGLVHYHEVLQVVIWPFPFPYAQMSFFLLVMHALLTPLIQAKTSQFEGTVFLLTLSSVTCMKGIELIAAELENPFGHDSNDLPTHEMHHEMSQDLICLVDPSTYRVPRLLPKAMMAHDLLKSDCEQRHAGLMEFQRQRTDADYSITQWCRKDDAKLSAARMKVERMNSWANQTYPESHARKMEKLFAMDDNVSDYSGSKPILEPSTVGAAIAGFDKEEGAKMGRMSQVGVPTFNGDHVASAVVKPLEISFQEFLSELSNTMQTCFSQQAESLKVESDLQLKALREVLQQLQTRKTSPRQPNSARQIPEGGAVEARAPSRFSPRRNSTDAQFSRLSLSPLCCQAPLRLPPETTRRSPRHR